MNDPVNAPQEVPPGKIICRYCGRLTSADANFCYYCARELVARPEHPAEEPRSMHLSRTAWIVLLVIIVLVVVAVFVWGRLR